MSEGPSQYEIDFNKRYDEIEAKKKKIIEDAFGAENVHVVPAGWNQDTNGNLVMSFKVYALVTSTEDRYLKWGDEKPSENSTTEE